MKIREAIPTKDNSTNFNVVADSTTKVGTTLENLKAAVCGETGASAKYAACAVAAKEQGYDQIARLFQATSAAEQVHIGLEAALIKSMEPDYVKPEAPTAKGAATDLNLIAGRHGRDLRDLRHVPRVHREGRRGGRGQGRPGVHARQARRGRSRRALHGGLQQHRRPDDDTYFLCPVCGYIEKGDDFEKCPICFCPKDKFRAF